MFRASSAHLQEDTAARVQLYPPEDERLGLETCRGEYYFMNK